MNQPEHERQDGRTEPAEPLPTAVESLMVAGLLLLAAWGGWLLYGPFIRLMPDFLARVLGG